MQVPKVAEDLSPPKQWGKESQTWKKVAEQQRNGSMETI